MNLMYFKIKMNLLGIYKYKYFKKFNLKFWNFIFKKTIVFFLIIILQTNTSALSTIYHCQVHTTIVTIV